MGDQPLLVLLEHWGWDTPARDGWCSIRCGHHEDSRASARVNLDEGAYICLACGLSAGSPATLVMRVKGLTWQEANAYLTTIGLSGERSGRDEQYNGKPWTKHHGTRFKQPWHRGRKATT
jgi:hypothetical protein